MGALRYRNNKLIAIVIVIVFGMVGFLGVNLRITKETMKTNKELQEGKKVILIDAGHGGMDGGSSSKGGTLEKDINLSIALKLKESLEKSGYDIVMTRDEETDFNLSHGTIRERYNEDLRRRCDLKKSTNCVMFISIHMNHFSESKYSGAQVWYSNHKDSTIFAGMVQKNLRMDLDPNNKRVQKAAKSSYKILREYDVMPSVLVECGFLSNYEEEQKLKSQEYQQKLADSISKSVVEFFKKPSMD